MKPKPKVFWVRRMWEPHYPSRPYKDTPYLVYSTKERAESLKHLAASMCSLGVHSLTSIRSEPGFAPFPVELLPHSDVEDMRREIEEMKATFDLRWKADMRAIKRWQKETGRKMVWPDHADLCVWLLEKLEGKATIRNLRKVGKAAPRRRIGSEIIADLKASCEKLEKGKALAATDVRNKDGKWSFKRTTVKRKAVRK